MFDGEGVRLGSPTLSNVFAECSRAVADPASAAFADEVLGNYVFKGTKSSYNTVGRYSGSSVSPGGLLALG